MWRDDSKALKQGIFPGGRRVARPALRYRRRERFAFRDREVATLHLFDNRE
jgi:hypothetical protein